MKFRFKHSGKISYELLKISKLFFEGYKMPDT